MYLEHIPLGENVPEVINVAIEIPAQGAPVKYEVDKEFRALIVDRFMGTAMFYPCNYGFVPHTLSDDGDPVDVLVITPVPVISGSVIACRPVALLKMTDEAGEDSKVLAVPTEKLTPLYKDVNGPEDLQKELLDQISHFFEQYKALESGKWVKVHGWHDAEEAKQEIINSIDHYKKIHPEFEG